MRVPSRLTEKKWSTFLDDCYDQKVFNFKEMMIKHNVGTGIISTLNDIRYVKPKGNSVYEWIGPSMLTDHIKKRFIELHRDKTTMRNKEYENKRKKKKQEIPTLFSTTNTSTNSQEAINAVQLLKSLGYRILKPINNYEEI